jgi:hypothetical protein
MDPSLKRYERDGEEKYHPEAMDPSLKRYEKRLFLREKSDETHDRSRDDATAIEGWEWEEIEYSEIDREEGDDREEYLPCKSDMHDIDEGRAYTDRSGEHFCRFSPLLSISRRYEFPESATEDIERHVRECVGLSHCSSERLAERE